MKTPLSETACLALGFDIKLSDDDTECNHFTLLSKHTDCVRFFFLFAMQEEKEKAVSSSSGPGGAASKDPNQVSIDTMPRPSRTTALKSSEFRKHGKQHLFVDTTVEQKQQRRQLQPCF